jgi:hypothetical protein
MSRQSTIAVIVSLLPAVIANFSSSLKAGEALIALMLLLLVLWETLYFSASWIAEALVSL